MAKSKRKPERDDPRKTLCHQVSVIANIIENEVSYFNGWSVSREAMGMSCMRAASKALVYLRRHGVAERRRYPVADSESKSREREWKRYAKNNRHYLVDEGSFNAGWQAAVREERQRCAFELTQMVGLVNSPEEKKVLRAAADAIRKGSE